MSNNQKNNKKTTKGFYIALSACVVALIVAIIVGINGTVAKLNKQTNDLAQNENSELLQDVNKDETSVPVEETQDSESDAQTEENQSSTDTTTQSASEVVQTEDTLTQNIEEELPVAATVSFARPLDGEIINSYSNGELVKSKTLNEWRTHDGIDIKSTVDTPVKAACSGIVEEVYEDPLWGTCITLSHDGNYQTFYKGLAPNTNVKVSQTVNLGDVIGYVGNTAEIEIAEETHLHFAVKQNDEWLDPEVLF